MRKPKLRELGEAVRALIKGPYTVAFPKKPSPAEKRFRGIIIFNEEKCIGCGACGEVCPSDARETIDDLERKVRKVIHYQDKCLYCGQCVDYCPTKEGIKHTQEYDLASLTRDNYPNLIEKELVTCEICGEVITTRAQLLWIAKRIGELAYSNPNLILTLNEELELAEETPPRGEFAPYRSDHLRFLCPRCRRKVYLHEIWGY